jgi:hypothetical protein
MKNATNMSQKLAALVFFAGGAALVLIFGSLVYLAIKDPPTNTIGSFLGALLYCGMGLISSVYLFNRGWRIWIGKEPIKSAWPK